MLFVHSTTAKQAHSNVLQVQLTTHTLNKTKSLLSNGMHVYNCSAVVADKTANVNAITCGFNKQTDLDGTRQQLNMSLLDLIASDGKPSIELDYPSITPSSPLLRPLNMQSSKLERNAQLLRMFQRLSEIKLHVEALTLLSAGIKRMELQQSQIRPIFTVECQLSNELIRKIPHHDMFHIMQFESEKYNSGLQCSRFGQEAKKNVQLCLDPNAGIGNPKWFTQKTNETVEMDEPNIGYLRFTVWWREPGTCLNEILGMAKLELGKHFNDSLLEQCKCIVIERQGMQLANLYCKITLQLTKELNAETVTVNEPNADILTVNELPEDLTSLIISSDKNNNKNINDYDYENENENDIENKTAAATATETATAMPADGGNKKGGKKTNYSGNANKKTQAGTGTCLPFNDKPKNDDAAKQAGNSNTANSGANNNGNGGMPPTAPNISKEHKINNESILLNGFIYAYETYKFQVPENFKYFLICRRFWEDNAVVFRTHENKGFKYKEIFKVIRNEPFFKRVERQQFTLEIWRRKSTSGNGNKTSSMRMIGKVDLPLHQFYIAFKEDVMVERLAQSACPVVSIDEWAPIKNVKTGVNIGFLKCAMAIGTEKQIHKFVRKVCLRAHTETNQNMTTVDSNTVQTTLPAATSTSCFNSAVMAAASNLSFTQNDAASADNAATIATTSKIFHAAANNKSITQSSNNNNGTMKLLSEKFQEALQMPQTSGLAASATAATAATTATTAPTIAFSNKNKTKPSFNLSILIQRAVYSFSLNPTIKDKKGFKRTAMSAVAKKYLANEAPTTYVTFQANEGHGVMLASEDGLVYATDVAIRTTQPNWQSQFRVSVDLDYVLNPKKLFILKIWQKTNMELLNDSYQRKTVLPMPEVDAAIGFVALNLSYLLQDKHMHGWYNIVDYNGRKNGALELRCVITKSKNKTAEMKADWMPAAAQCSLPSNANLTHTSIACNALKRKKSDVESAMPSVKATNSALSTAAVAALPSSLKNGYEMSCNFGNALTFEITFQRQLSEMDEINRRLRERLSFVTGTQFSSDSFASALPLDNWEPFSSHVSQDIADIEMEQFWNDINVCAEEAEDTEETECENKLAADNKEIVNHMISLTLNDDCPTDVADSSSQNSSEVINK